MFLSIYFFHSIHVKVLGKEKKCSKLEFLSVSQLKCAFLFQQKKGLWINMLMVRASVIGV